MKIYQKVYVSTSIKQMSTSELDILVNHATKENHKNQITGILLFTGTSYLQLLEGEISKVKQTYKKIFNDPRHTSLSIICQRQINERCYPKINFSFRTTDEATLQAIYTLFLENPDLAIKKMNLMTEVKLSKTIGFDPERLLFYSNEEPSQSTTAESFYKFSTQLAADEVFLMKDDSEIVYVNNSACKKLEYKENELLGKKVWEWDPLFPKEVWPGFWLDFVKNKHLHFQTQHKKKSGEVFPVEIHAHLYEENNKKFLLAFVNDISQKMQAHKELTEHRKNLENIILLRTEKLNQTYEELRLHKEMMDKYIGVLILDEKMRIKYANDFFVKVVSNLKKSKKEIYDSIQQQIQYNTHLINKPNNSCVWKGEINLNGAINKQISFDVSLYKFEKEENKGFYLIGYDITEKLKQQKALEFYANHDPLSGLKNYKEFDNTFHTLFNKYKKRKTKSNFALILIDIDDFKTINDTKGHLIGDRVICYIANTLKNNCNNSDEVFRIGGDEFAILTDLYEDYKYPADLSEKILKCFDRKINIEQEKLQVSCSIGISVYPDNGRSLKNLHINADSALYKSKRQGKGCYNFFTKEINEKSERSKFIKNNICKGINNNEFEINYQPIIDTNTNSVVAYDAFAIWQSMKGNINSKEFIEIAENSHIFQKLNKHLLIETLENRKNLPKEGKVSIYCSIKQLSDDENFSNSLIEIIESHNLKCEDVILKISEKIFTDEYKDVDFILSKLTHKGFTILVDQFGLGYYSLPLLISMPYHFIKLNDNFKTSDLSKEVELKSIINICESLGKKVIIGGINTPKQAKIFKAMGASLMQGDF